jgi:hypothetical protein
MKTTDLVILIIYSLILIYFGFIKSKPGYLTWSMFSNSSVAYFEIYHGDVKVIPWEYVPHTMLYFHPYEIHMFLSYLHDVKKIESNGNIVLFMNGEKIHLEIKKGNVI